MSTDVFENWKAPTLAHYAESVDAMAAKKELLGGLLHTDCTALISGKAKRAYKTWWAMWLATKVAAGPQENSKEDRFAADKPRRVYFLEAEGPRKETINRWRYIARGLGIDPYGDWMENIKFAHREPRIHLDVPRELNALELDVKEWKPDLIIVDTLAAHQYCNENSVSEMQKVMDKITELKGVTEECSVLVLHHLRKDSKDGIQVDIDEDLRGSSAISAAYDFHHGIRSVLGMPGTNLLTHRYSEGGEQKFEVTWSIDKEAGIATCQIEDHDPDRASVAMMEYITGEMVPDWDYSLEIMATIIKEPKAKSLKVLREMVKRGYLEQHKAGGTKWSLRDRA